MSLRIVLPLQSVDDSDENIFKSKFDKITTRHIVFFDEQITGYIVFDGSFDQTKDFIRLDVAVLPSEITEEEDPLSRVNSESNVELILGQEAMVYSDQDIHIWKFEVPVNYPRKRFQEPQFCFLVDQNNDKQVVEENGVDEEVLPNYFPCMKRNLLGELDYQQSSFISSSTSLQESTIVSQDKSMTDNSISVSAKLSIPVTVSLVIKLKSTKPAGRNNMLLATLNIECSEELMKEVNPDKFFFNILDIQVVFKSGSVESISDLIPIRIKCTDSVNLAYKFTNYEVDAKDGNSSKPIHISLTLQVQQKIDGDFQNMSNRIKTEWSPYLDFGLIAPPINNALKTSSNNLAHTQSQATLSTANIRQKVLKSNIYKLKSASLSSTNNFSNSASNLRRAKAPLIHPSGRSSSVTVNLTTGTNSSLSGLKLTFIGKLDLKLGEIVNWKIQAINNSMNRLNLSLLVQNPINFNPVYNGNNATTTNFSSSNLLSGSNGIASKRDSDIIIYNKSQLYSLYNSLKVNGDGAGVLILNNDIRIGPLDPNTVFETEIQLVGISKGIFNLDGIKVFDINSGDGIDFGKLVEVFVV
ncbi:LOW QUALITY PROTEIN: TRS65 Trafficking protein particle complex II-specific subunit 65 [Candida maltosa Xu316]